jgi:rhamnosyltransferase subunit B
VGKRIVVSCWGSHGDLFPYIGLSLALQARGHSVVIATPEVYRANVEQEGLDFAPVGPSPDPRDRVLIARAMDPVKGSEFIIRELLLPKLREHYAELEHAAAGADWLVSHPITYAAPLLAERRGLPWVSTVLAPMLFFSVHDLPVMPTAVWLTSRRTFAAAAARPLVALARAVTRSWMAPVHALRAELGLPRARHPLFEGQFSPYGTLALFSRTLAAPQRDWPPHVALTGFVFYNGPAALAPEIEEFLAAGEPPVVFTLGTSAVGAAGRFYTESAAAAAKLGVRAVLLTGGFEQNRPEGALPPGVLLVERAPHQLLFPRASAVVHQAGAGTLGQGLRSGQPMLAVPHGHDQFDNAFRATELGVARTLLPRDYQGERVARELRALLTEPRYRARAAEIGAVVGAEGGAADAALALERLLGGVLPQP